MLGVLSLLIWALILVVTVKYVLITMRADNRGEGGSLALLALIQRVAPRSALLPAIAAAALLATGLFYGDAMITPAISILSAVEGLELLRAGVERLVIPLTLAIVSALFAVQRWGTGWLGIPFGPVLAARFVRRRPGPARSGGLDQRLSADSCSAAAMASRYPASMERS